MAGRPKRGIEYSGWDVDIFENDTKIDELLDAQGWIGFSIYFYLCQKAYASDGYFYRWSYANAATTARRMGGGIGSETVRQTVGACLQIGLFDKRLFDLGGVLTSKGIQRRYAQAVQNRRSKTANKTYWLLDEVETRGFGIALENEELLPANGDSLPANAPKSKVKESRVKESRVEESSSAGKLRGDTAARMIAEKGFGRNLEEAVEDWVRYKTEKRQGYRETGFRNLLSQIQAKASEHGEEKVAALIRECMANNWQGIIWDRLSQGGASRSAADRIATRVSEVDNWLRR